MHLQLTWRSASITHDLTPTSMRKVTNTQLCSAKIHSSLCQPKCMENIENAIVTDKIKQDLTEHILLISHCSHLTFYQRLLLFLEITSAASHLLPACIRISLLVSRHLPCKSALLTKSLTFTKVMGLNLHIGLRFQQSGLLHVGLSHGLCEEKKKRSRQPAKLFKMK